MQGARVVYKILPRVDAERFRDAGTFEGSPLDLRDGFIHFSTAAQLRETLARHYKGVRDLRVLGVSVALLPTEALRWEPSRGGALFPHLYAVLPWASVVERHDVDVGDDGTSVLPPGFP